jgi:hypothetical protein
MDKTEFKFPDEKELEAKQETKGDDGFEFDIEVIDDTPDPDKGRKPLPEPVGEVTDDELSKYDESVQKRIKKLSHGYHDERRAKEAALREREEALRFAQQIVEENKRLKTDLSSSSTLLVGTAKDNAEMKLNQAKQKYKEAYDSGDSDALLQAQDELTIARLTLDKLSTNTRESKKPLQEQETPVNIAPRPAPEPPRADPKALAWQQQNRWFGDDEEMTSFALGLHEKLVKSGVDPTSDEYYERVNSRIREKFPENFPGLEEKSKRTSSNVVAPASRNVAPKKITLTQTQVALAKKLKIPLDLYARKVAEGMTNG